MMTTEEAILVLRADPTHADLIRDAYLGDDTQEASERFATSGEYAEEVALLGGSLAGGLVLDLGAGNGIATRALADSGARAAIALDPDTGTVAGLGALRQAALPRVCAVGEAIPLADSCVDVVFARQVLHHAHDLAAMVSECARILRPAGVFLACREHVADDEGQLQAFLAGHPVHQLAGGEHAFTLPQYLAAIEAAGLVVERVIGPWGGLINAFPDAKTPEELAELPASRLRRRLGGAGAAMARIPGVTRLTRHLLEDRAPGRLYSFLARRPSS